VSSGLLELWVLVGRGAPETLPAPAPEAFRGMTAAALAEDLKRTVTDEALPAALLAEAEAHYEGADARAESAERRATTLQGAVAIAAGLTLSGGGLLLDTSKIRGDSWRGIFAVGLVAVTGCLIVAGYHAVVVTARLHMWATPNAEDLLERAGRRLRDAQLERAADLLIAYGRNAGIATKKLDSMSQAARWFVRGLMLILAAAALLAAYAIAQSPA
jgi:hypothetical protein